MIDDRPDRCAVAILGGGPAGLMAADILSKNGVFVEVYDRMATMGRKFLMAGRGGLNLTHSEPMGSFIARYGAAGEWMKPILQAFDPQALRAWAEELGQPTFVGSSGRVFPRAMKASPLLRALMARLSARGVRFFPRHEWRGWNEEGDLVFARPDGTQRLVHPDRTILALGGASWPRLGSDGGWAKYLAARGVRVEPFRAANCGVTVDWSEAFAARFSGHPLKRIALTSAGQHVRGEAMITQYGLEGGAVYALSGVLRDTLAREGTAFLDIDLRPDLSSHDIVARLEKSRRAKESTSNLLRKALHFSPCEIALLREMEGETLPRDAQMLGARIKSGRLTLSGVQQLERAISSAGGLSRDEVDCNLRLKAMPNVFAVGEMLDWEAPTGGYLLQACFAMGVVAARAILKDVREAGRSKAQNV